jgi:FkbM family methyltransferase
MTTVSDAASEMVGVAKAVLKRTVYRPGTIARVLWGPLRGARFMLRETPNWASIVGRWEPEAAKMYRQLIRPGDTVYDCGANVGIHSLLFSRLVGARGRVVAFEPLPAAARDIALNCALNAADNVTIAQQALSDQIGEDVFRLAQNTTQGSLSGLSGNAASEITVQVTTLDELIRKGLPPPDFIKMDIEGAEGAALMGFERVVDSFPTFAIDLHTPEQDVHVGAFFARHGYEVYRLGDEVARREGQKELLRPVTVLDRGWPDREGIWGTVIGLHPSRAPECLPPSVRRVLTSLPGDA